MLRSTTIPFEHGFTTRAEGSMTRADPAGLARVAPAPLYVARQVHGRAVVVLSAAEPPEAVRGREADALVTAGAQGAVGVFTADCVPVLLCDVDKGLVAAVHAGWRGLRAGVVQAAVTAMEQLGARARTLRAALGPCIGPCCYEVGPEVVAAFHEAFPEARDAVVARGDADRPALDLRRLARAALARVGVAGERVDGEPPCTRCEAERFFSFRREGPGCGQQLSFIVAPEARGPR